MLSAQKLEATFYKRIRQLKLCGKKEARIAARKAAAQVILVARRCPSVSKAHLAVLETPTGYTFGVEYEHGAMTGSERDIFETMHSENVERFEREYGDAL